MIDLDDILQKQLASLHQGVPLEEVLATLPPEASQLAPILRTAAAVRSVEHPTMPREVALAQQARVVRSLPAASRPFSLFEWLSRSQMQVGLAAAAFAAIILVVGISLFVAGPASAHSARLEALSGTVQVAPSADSSAWRALSNGDALTQGEHIRTGDAAGATLVFFDGSRTNIGPNSDVVLTRLNGRWGNVLQVQMSQTSGATNNNVVPLVGSSSFFLVDTPSGQASVHGTSFDVAVSANGEATFAVTHGKVKVENSKSQVLLTAGQATTVLPGADPSEPGYQFRLNGALGAMTPTQWVVAGQPIAITPQTVLPPSPQAGAMLSVQGRILSTGDWVADRVMLAKEDKSPSHFTGLIQAMPPVPSTWTIGGQDVLVTNETELGDGLEVGTPVEVTFTILPDQAGWLAKSIESLEESKPEATQTVTATATMTLTLENPSETPTVTETPTQTVTGTLDTTTPTLTATATETVVPKNDSARCDNRTEQQPEAVKLAQQFGVTYDEIIGWFCKGFGFGEIQQAYDLSRTYGVDVTEIFRLRSSGLGWGQIKKMVPGMSAATGTPVPNDHGNPNKGKKTPKK